MGDLTFAVAVFGFLGCWTENSVQVDCEVVGLPVIWTPLARGLGVRKTTLYRLVIAAVFLDRPSELTFQ
jgi:hypothetical protein